MAGRKGWRDHTRLEATQEANRGSGPAGRPRSSEDLGGMQFIELLTWPIEADATGRSKAVDASEKTSVSGRPISASSRAWASSCPKGWTWSRSSWSCSMYAGGRRSGRMATACPTFTKAGPCPQGKRQGAKQDVGPGPKPSMARKGRNSCGTRAFQLLQIKTANAFLEDKRAWWQFFCDPRCLQVDRPLDCLYAKGMEWAWHREREGDTWLLIISLSSLARAGAPFAMPSSRPAQTAMGVGGL